MDCSIFNEFSNEQKFKSSFFTHSRLATDCLPICVCSGTMCNDDGDMMKDMRFN